MVSHGFAARMVVYSRVIPLLRGQGLSVVLLVPEGDTAHLNSIAEEMGFRVEVISTGALRGGRLSGWIRPYLFEDVGRNPALRAKHLRSVRRMDARGLASRAFFVLNRAACRIARLRRALVNWQRGKLRSRVVGETVKKLRPAVVVSTYPVNDLEASVLLEAQCLGIPTVGQLLSWDNITSKGRWLVIPDLFLAWGSIMAEELGRYYGVGGERVMCTGVTHFDTHINGVTRPRIVESLERLGLEGERPYLLFGMSSPVFAPTEIEVVEHVARLVESDQFGAEMQLVVRPHPQNVMGSMADMSWLPRLEMLRSSRVAVQFPLMVRSSLPWATEREDMLVLANLIGGCSVCINSGSTLSLDAIIQDRPVVLPLFDVGSQWPWWASARRIGDYIHQRTMIELGGVTVTHSLEETMRAIAVYLADPSVHSAGRRLTRDRELGPCDGRASERVARALQRLVAEGYSAGVRALSG